ncbi:hypothetical protein HRR78_002842 [Exophiala dermatitidis]|nr:hypothetical protein HRR75_004762 [Exophiala dermatitidis]KAJ4554438.1 hypothetical protein HRR78_002842 [Exophiala dermatitidis]
MGGGAATALETDGEEDDDDIELELDLEETYVLEDDVLCIESGGEGVREVGKPKAWVARGAMVGFANVGDSKKRVVLEGSSLHGHHEFQRRSDTEGRDWAEPALHRSEVKG